MDSKRKGSDYRKKQAASAGELAPNFERKHRAGQKKEHAYPYQANPANLPAQDQQLSWPVHTADFHERDKQRRDECRCADRLADVAGGAHPVKVIRQTGDHAGENDRCEVAQDSQWLDIIITDRPLTLVSQRIGQLTDSTVARPILTGIPLCNTHMTGLSLIQLTRIKYLITIITHLILTQGVSTSILNDVTDCLPAFGFH